MIRCGYIYNNVPHLAQGTCVTIMIAAWFWAIEVGRAVFTLALGLIAVALVSFSAVPLLRRRS